jgi:hypothetical protein
MKNSFTRIWIYFWMLLTVLLMPLPVGAISRDEIMKNAEAYKAHEWTPTNKNVCHTNKIDTPDRNTYKTWTDSIGWKWKKENNLYVADKGVPYNWGGSSSLGDFDGGVGNGSCAGNINTNYGLQKGTVGVDCSGFVSRAWNLKSKSSTRALPDIAAKLDSYEDLKKGDIVNKYASHVMLCAEDNPIYELNVYESSAHDWKVNTRNYKNIALLKADNYIPYSYTNNMDVEMLFDTSSSMAGQIDKMRLAAGHFVDFLNVGDKIGVMSFNTSASRDYDMQEITKDNIDAVDSAAKEAIYNRLIGGHTAIGTGLSSAREELNIRGVNARGAKDTTRAIVLMSDGWDNIDMNTPDDKDVPVKLDGILKAIMIPDGPPPMLAGEALSGLIQEGIKVYAFGTGIMANSPLLYDIAKQTGGKYYSMPKYDSFADAFEQMATELSEKQYIRKWEDYILSNERRVNEFKIDSGLNIAIYGLNWQGSDFDLTLTAPDGTVIDHNTVRPDVRFVEGPTFEYYELQNPATGTWKTEIYGKDVPTGGEKVQLSLSGSSSLPFAVNFDKQDYAQRERVRITASVADPVLDTADPQYIKNVKLSGQVSNPNDELINFDFFDDGKHGDGVAGDGVYGGDFMRTELAGSYQFTIRVSGSTNREGDAFEREKSETIVVKQGTKPVAEAGGPYEGRVGAAVVFDAGGSTDPQDIALKYRWDFDSDGVFDTDYSSQPKAEFTYWHGFAGNATLEVYDGTQTATDTAAVKTIGAKQLKESASTYLGSLSGTNLADKTLLKTAGLSLSKTLEAKAWQDDSRLQPNLLSGTIAFDLDAATLLQLQLLRKMNFKVSDIDKMIGQLTGADEILAKVLIHDRKIVIAAMSSSAKKKAAENSIALADKSYASAEAAVASGNSTMAIENFKQSWISALKVELPTQNVFVGVEPSAFTQVIGATSDPVRELPVCSFM